MDFEWNFFLSEVRLFTVPYFFIRSTGQSAGLPERTVISVTLEPRKRASGFTYPRWPPVTQSLRSRRSYGKIGDCESTDERDIWWIWRRTKYTPTPPPRTITQSTPLLFQHNRPVDWDVSQVQVQVRFALFNLVQNKTAYRISRLTNDQK